LDLDPDAAVAPVHIPGNHSIDDNIDAEWNRDLIRQAITFEQNFGTVGRKKRKKGDRKSPHKTSRHQTPDNQNRPRPTEQKTILPSGPGSVNSYGMPIKEVDYTRRIKTYRVIDGEKVDILRYQGLLAKQKFLKMLAGQHGDRLRDVFKLEQCEIDGMREGFTPQGLSVHHKHPLGGAGNPAVAARANDFDNLILIQMTPYHTAIHNYLDPQIDDMAPGETRKVRVPWPEGYWYEPPKPHIRSGPPKCDKQPEDCPHSNSSVSDDIPPHANRNQRPSWKRIA